MSKPHGNKESWLAALRAEGAALHTAIENGDLEAEVPTCPGWTLRHLAFHVGAVYQRVAQHIVRGVVSRPEPATIAPEEGHPLTYFDRHYNQIVQVLDQVDSDLPAWNPAPQSKKA